METERAEAFFPLRVRTTAGSERDARASQEPDPQMTLPDAAMSPTSARFSDRLHISHDAATAVPTPLGAIRNDATTPFGGAARTSRWHPLPLGFPLDLD
jgi:hypothetical protein